jgi:hypothetical protein
MAEHTPGPWAWGEDGHGVWAQAPRGERRIASLPLTAFAAPGVHPIEQARAERIATARLIAATPELLEALRAAAQGLECAADDLDDKGLGVSARSCRKRAVAARAAIAKAEGRS